MGVLAGILSALYWPAIYFDGELLTASLETLLGAALLLTLLRAGQGKAVLPFLGAGVIWGLACITRPNFLALAPVIVLWLFLLTPVMVSQRRRIGRPGATFDRTEPDHTSRDAAQPYGQRRTHPHHLYGRRQSLCRKQSGFHRHKPSDTRNQALP